MKIIRTIVAEAADPLTEDDMSLRDKGAITGVGETSYSRNSGRSVVALQMDASLAAIADAGLTPKDIDGVIAYAASGVVAAVWRPMRSPSGFPSRSISSGRQRS